MINFFLGLGLGVLGFTIFEFSSMFGLYRAQKDENSIPWYYWLFRSVSYLLMALGLYFVLHAFFF